MTRLVASIGIASVAVTLLAGTAAGQGRGSITSFPAQQREPADPAVVARGRAVYDTDCRSCHGPDLRGGERGGPNLLRSKVMLNDREGELLQQALESTHQGRLSTPTLPLDDITAVAAHIHSVLARAPGQGAPPPGPAVELNVLVGNAAAGEQYFAARCATCHSAVGDLKGIGARGLAPVQLQNLWIVGGRDSLPAPGPRPAPMSTRREVTVVVIAPAGQRYEGRLERFDEFVVSLTQADGTRRSFQRSAALKVEVRDPLEAHRRLLPQYTDKDIHDVTAYLASLK